MAFYCKFYKYIRLRAEYTPVIAAAVHLRPTTGKMIHHLLLNVDAALPTGTTGAITAALYLIRP